VIGERGELAGEPRGVAAGDVAHVPPGRGADGHLAAVCADRQVDVEAADAHLGHAALEVGGAGQRALDVVLTGSLGAEQHQHLVVDHALHQAAVSIHDAPHPPQQPVVVLEQLLGLNPRRQLCEAVHVDDQGRHALALALRRAQPARHRGGGLGVGRS
jgi:hypothetical protein